MTIMDRIFLIGGRGVGKTTVGKLLAAQRDWDFADVDDDVVKRSGMSITAIFYTEGEPAFRKLETRELTRLVATPTEVIATGGGIVLAKANRDLLATQGFVVWLTASAEAAFQRTLNDPSTPDRRPNLTPYRGAAEMEFIFREREPLYREVANLIVDTTDLSPNEVVSAILAECSLS